MNAERAAEIIAAYGGDPARWPVDERAAALHLIESNAALLHARQDALALDAELSQWSRDWSAARSAPGDAAGAAARVLTARDLTARQVARPPRPVWRWAVGTGLAAAVAAGVMLTNSFAVPLHAPAAQRAADHGPVSDAAAFAMVFTPTPDEDSSI